MRYFRWETFLVAAFGAIIAIVAIGIVAPGLPGVWCTPEETRRVCYREWLGVLSGWAAFIAALVALSVQRTLADRDHRRATREANRPLLEKLDKLVNEVLSMKLAGAAGDHVAGDFGESYLLNDPTIGELDARIPGFGKARIAALKEAQTYNRRVEDGHSTDANHAFHKILVGIYKRLERGESVEEVANS